MIETIKKEIKAALDHEFKKIYQIDIQFIVEEPKKIELGDLSIPLFNIMKLLKKPLNECGNEVSTFILNHFPLILEANLIGGFLNLSLNKEEISMRVLKEINTLGQHFGTSNIGKDKTIVLDYSAPNLAKSFSIGHLRSTMIGNSLKLIKQKCGYHVVGINHLGDWGTQFGKMIVAYKKWGNKESILNDPICELTKLYVKFHEESEIDSSLEAEARQEFRKLELHDQENMRLWQWFKEESFKEFMMTYDLLNVQFDSYDGEAFFNDKMDGIVNELTQKKLLRQDQGAMIVELEDNMPPALIKRSDGGTLYITRDLACLFYRKQTYQFDKCLYVVGNEQKLHFNQMKKVIEKMGYSFYQDIEHINFGLVLQDGKKMSTRKGRVVKLYDVIQEAIALSLKQINEKNANLEDKEMTAKKIGVGAIIFNDLKNHRTLEVEFNLEQMLKFEGQTGPYLQYTSVRIASILNNTGYNINELDKNCMTFDHYFELTKLLSQFGSFIYKAHLENAPSIIAKYLLNVAQNFNKFYSLEKINCEDILKKNTNLALASATRIVLNEGMRLLGMEYLDKM